MSTRHLRCPRPSPDHLRQCREAWRCPGLRGCPVRRNGKCSAIPDRSGQGHNSTFSRAACTARRRARAMRTWEVKLTGPASAPWHTKYGRGAADPCRSTCRCADCRISLPSRRSRLSSVTRATCSERSVLKAISPRPSMYYYAPTARRVARKSTPDFLPRVFHIYTTTRSQHLLWLWSWLYSRP